MLTCCIIIIIFISIVIICYYVVLLLAVLLLLLLFRQKTQVWSVSPRSGTKATCIYSCSVIIISTQVVH